MNLVVLGAPGAGKGTQARNLAQHFGICHISTGDILRDHMKNETAIGISISEMMKKGQLVPDELVINIVRERICQDDCKKGFILDGFPRTLNQAEIFEHILNKLNLKIDCVISVDVADDIIIERMSGRVVCPACNTMYHTVYFPPAKVGICDKCGTELTQREDDKEKTVKDRLRIYHKITEPITEFYDDRNLLFRISGIGDVVEITNSITKFLETK